MTVTDVSERIVEVPYVIGTILRDLLAGARILDFGASESTVSLSLASMGYRVTALDSRGYPFEHPNLTVIRTLVEEWDGSQEPFDRIVAISAIEHVGVGYYDSAETTRVDDRRLVELFGNWLVPGGSLVMTVPYGRWAVDDLQRTYDDAHLDALLVGWVVTRRSILSEVGRVGSWRGDLL